MESKKNLVFLGMMGSGKSSIGLLVSKKLNKDFIDVDDEIEKKLDMKISKIFENKGEKYFRGIEEEITLKLLKNKKSVISLGGGAFLNNKIKKEILDKHISFWLNWEPKTLVERIQSSKKRPIAFQSSKNELMKLIKDRYLIYTNAHHKINCENLSKSEIVSKILELYETH
tara:strand:- start:740 stop:1252 length:513 start_codon:yes stop_codon:yes gene_type:complete